MPKLNHTLNAGMDVATNPFEDVPTAAEPTSMKCSSGKIIIHRKNVSRLSDGEVLAAKVGMNKIEIE